MRNRKSKKIYILFIVVCLNISVGYAYLSQDLKLDTSITIAPEKDTLLINQFINQAMDDTAISFGAISSDTNGKGVYKLTKIETSTPIYYYRGAVENNNVIFGGFCWKMIRTTETGGIKIIYNGESNNGVCDATGNATEIGRTAFNSSSNDPKYIGYMYDNNTKDSTIKGVIDTWYEENLLSYQDYLEDTPFYNERDSKQNGQLISYAPRQRIWGVYGVGNEFLTTVPNTYIKLGAVNAEDIFNVSSEIGNGALTYPIGLITTDEVVMAGGRGWMTESDVGRSNAYINFGVNYWTMSPSCYIFNNANVNDVVFVGGVGNLDYMILSTNLGVRPVVSLKPGTSFLSGNGTKNDPFVITE